MGAVTVVVAVSESGATVAGTAPASVEFGAGVATATLALATVDDEVAEAASVIRAEVSAGSGYEVGTPGVAEVTVRDDDAEPPEPPEPPGPGEPPGPIELPRLRITDARGMESDGHLKFTVKLSAASDRVMTVRCTTVEGTAKAGADYVDDVATLTFLAGETSKEIEDGTALGTIEDDEAEPRVVIADASAAEGAGSLRFEVRLTAMSERGVTVRYASEDGTATAGEDYEAVSGTLTFAVNELTKMIEVVIHQDERDEGTAERFTVKLSEPRHATLAVEAATGTIEDDDDVLPALSGWLVRYGRTV